MTDVDIINAKIKELIESICDGKVRTVGEVKSIQDQVSLLEARRVTLLREPRVSRRSFLGLTWLRRRPYTGTPHRGKGR